MFFPEFSRYKFPPESSRLAISLLILGLSSQTSDLQTRLLRCPTEQTEIQTDEDSPALPHCCPKPPCKPTCAPPKNSPRDASTSRSPSSDAGVGLVPRVAGARVPPLTGRVADLLCVAIPRKWGWGLGGAGGGAGALLPLERAAWAPREPKKAPMCVRVPPLGTGSSQAAPAR